MNDEGLAFNHEKAGLEPRIIDLACNHELLALNHELLALSHELLDPGWP